VGVLKKWIAIVSIYLAMLWWPANAQAVTVEELLNMGEAQQLSEVRLMMDRCKEGEVDGSYPLKCYNTFSTEEWRKRLVDFYSSEAGEGKSVQQSMNLCGLVGEILLICWSAKWVGE